MMKNMMKSAIKSVMYEEKSRMKDVTNDDIDMCIGKIDDYFTKFSTERINT